MNFRPAVFFVTCTLAPLCAHAQDAPKTSLPIRRVVLFSSGVGYFERQGEVRGATSVPLSFRVSQVNDVLKSLVIFDREGGVRPVTFATKDSLQRQLAQGNISLDPNQSLGGLLRQFRGARVRVESGGKTIEGQILSVETRTKTDDKDHETTEEILNLLTAEGLRAVPLDGVGNVQLLDETLNRQLMGSLALTAGNLDDSKRTVQLNFDGAKARSVRAAYLLEAAVWKTSYRLVLDPTGKQLPYLQGWGQIENTTDDDWTNVDLSLVSGRPISFIQDLYQPLYVARPVVQPQIIGSPTPQLYGETVETENKADKPEDETAPRAAPVMRAPARSMNGPAGFSNGGGFGGRGGGGGGGFGGGGFAADGRLLEAGTAPGLGVSADDLAKTASQAQGAARGELFEYAIKTPVTLARNQAALVPIVSENIGGEAVSIYDPTSSENILSGFRFKNSTSLHLSGGPLTVFQSGTYAGDAQINDVGPGEERLISYAVDLELVPVVQEPNFRADTLSLSAKSGVLIITRKQTRTVSYTLKNKSDKAKKVVVVQPLDPNFKLIEPAKEVQKTAAEYRFDVTVPAGKTVEFKTVSERPISETVALIDLDLNVLVEYARNAQASPALKTALQSLVAQRRKIAELQTTRADREKDLAAIDTEQNRIRQNMAQLDRNSDLYKQYVVKLTAQEARVDALRTEIAKLRADELAAQDALRKSVDGLTIA